MAELHEASSSEDGVQPPADRARIAELVHVPERREERVVDRILGARAVPEERERGRVEPGPVAVEQQA
jgi:hypothetical protein